MPSATAHLSFLPPAPRLQPTARLRPLCTAPSPPPSSPPPPPRPPTLPRTTRARPHPPPSDPRDDRWAPENLGFLHVATIAGPHGVRGHAKAVAETDFERLRLARADAHSPARYLLLPGRRYPRPVAIAAARQASQKRTWILTLRGVNSREDVARLRGARLYVKEHDRPRLASGEFMVADLVRTTVQIRDAHLIVGVVETVLTKEELCRAAGSGRAGAAVAADLLEIALFDVPKEDPAAIDSSGQPAKRFQGDFPEKAKRVLVPFVKSVVPVVDLKRATITIDPPTGLLDIAVVNKKEKRKPPRGLLMPAKD